MTSYIKCQNCGFQNEIQSEYLTFCGECKKKLHTNFRQWFKENRSGTFEEYKASFGSVHREIIQEKDKLSANHPQIKHLYIKVVVVVLLLLAVVFTMFSNLFTDSQLVMYVHSLIQEKQKELEWEFDTYGDYGLQFESPVELNEIPVDLPRDMGRLVVDLQLFASDFDNDIALMVVSNKFHKKASNVNLEASISRFVDQIRQLKGIGDFTIQQEETSLSGYQGFKQVGQFTRNGQLKGFVSIGVGERQMLWQIMIVYNLRNKELEKAKDRILNSVKIQYNNAL